MEYILQSIKSWYNKGTSNKPILYKREEFILKKPDKYKNINTSTININGTI